MIGPKDQLLREIDDLRRNELANIQYELFGRSGPPSDGKYRIYASTQLLAIQRLEREVRNNRFLTRANRLMLGCIVAQAACWLVGMVGVFVPPFSHWLDGWPFNAMVWAALLGTLIDAPTKVTQSYINKHKL